MSTGRKLIFSQVKNSYKIEKWKARPIDDANYPLKRQTSDLFFTFKVKKVGQNYFKLGFEKWYFQDGKIIYSYVIYWQHDQKNFIMHLKFWIMEVLFIYLHLSIIYNSICPHVWLVAWFDFRPDELLFIYNHPLVAHLAKMVKIVPEWPLKLFHYECQLGQ